MMGYSPAELTPAETSWHALRLVLKTEQVWSTQQVLPTEHVNFLLALQNSHIILNKQQNLESDDRH